MDKIKLTLLLAIFYAITSVLKAQPSEKWGDQGDGTYVNPIVPADFSDLDAIRVGDDYYAISSTMQYSPGMVILHSKDMVNWGVIGHVVDDLTRISPELNWDRMNCYGRGIWAGSIRYYKNRFWVYFGTPDDGFFMSSAIDPAGHWEPLHQVWNVSGWDDCCSFCDDDGQLYFIATNFDLDPKNNKKYNIHLFKMAPDGKSLIMESDTIIYQSQGSEANKLYKINGLYYHYFSEVKDEGRVIMMGRSENLYGPWEVKQLNHVDPKNDREPNQGALLESASGEWYFLTHHGTGGHWEGRVVSLLPVIWMDRWPIIGEVGKDTIGQMVWSGLMPIEKDCKHGFQTSDDFNLPKLNVQWEWNYQPRTDKWSLTDRKGFLRLYAFRPIRPDDSTRIILRAGNTITQRVLRTKKSVVTVRMDISNMEDGQYAGITHLSTESYSMFGVKQENGGRHLVYECNGEASRGIKLTGKYVWFKSKWDYNGVNQYFICTNGKSYVPFGDSSQLTWGSYRGDRIGIFNYNIKGEKGYVDVDWFRYDYLK
ncbi:glycoside hydrolase family 43 protein [Gaoshiqia sp. Z1-71]|uniref:glycoside hydrolase family 43 protein n=1 Tax=Gaoshiqia hydrogeniformans TaxID=3290090 RepID=UPI003BF83EE8